MKYYPEISASMKKRGIVDLQVGAYSYPRGQSDESSTSSTSTDPTEEGSQSSDSKKNSLSVGPSAKSKSADSSSSSSIDNVDYQTQQRRATQNSVQGFTATDEVNPDGN